VGSEKTAKVWLSAVVRSWSGPRRHPTYCWLTGDGATRLLEAYVDEFQGQSSGAHLVISEVAAS
jgi:hypothetical protein